MRSIPRSASSRKWFVGSNTTWCACGPCCRALFGPDPVPLSNAEDAASRPSGPTGKHRDVAAGVVRDRDELAGFVALHVAGRGTACRFHSQRREPARRSVDGERRHAPGLGALVLVNLVDGVQHATRTAHGEEAGTGRLRLEAERRQHPGGVVEAEGIDPLAIGVRARVGPDEDETARLWSLAGGDGRGKACEDRDTEDACHVGGR